MLRSRPHGISFRTKLVLALIGVVTPVLIVALLVIRRETSRQVSEVLAQALAESRAQLQRVEKLRQTELLRLGHRFGAQNRVPFALQQALEGDTAFLSEQTVYELQLAGVRNALAVFADLDGNAVLALRDNQPIERADSALALNVIEKLVNGDTAAFGYHRLADRLYSVHPTTLSIVTQPVGFLMLGFPIDESVASSIGGAIGAEVCFVAAGRCLVGTPGATPLSRDIEQTARSSRAKRIERDGKSFALHATVLPGLDGAVVIALPLDNILRPFVRIQRALFVVGGIALTLAIAFAVLLGRGLARPVRALVHATERVAGGDYTSRVDITSRDELGRLGVAFNDMTYGLQLRDKYKGVLDKVVSRDIANELVKGEITLGGENREVSMLFADLRGFTPLTEGMEPQQVIGILNDIMERLSGAVEAEGGVVDKYVGDELMALFGAPKSYGDDAVRAVRAAQRMQQSITEYNAVHRNGLKPVRIGIGINTGVVVAGNMGSQRRLNYTVLGEPVNLAARLCSAAAPGQILISESTAALVGGEIPTSSLGDRTLKGFSSAIPVHEVSASGAMVPAQ